MNKDAKATEYRIEPLVKLLRSEVISDGGTQKKAEALEGKWIRLNEYEHVFEEEGKATRVYIDKDIVGCACGRCNNNLMCKHIIAFEALKSPPQLTIESPDCRWLREYLSGLGWYAENRYLYPPIGEGLPEDEPSWAPDGEEPAKLDPVNEDKEMDIGVDEDPEPKKYTRKCGHTGCDYIEVGEDRGTVVAGIAEHRRTCPKNPANKKKPTVAKDATVEKPPKEGNVTNNLPRDKSKMVAIGDDRLVEVDDDEKIIRDSATVKKPPKEEDKKVKEPSTAVAETKPNVPAVKKEMPTEAEFQSVKVGRLMRSQGSIYKVSGKEVADSAAVSSYAVAEGVSTETTVLEQTAEYARATVRAYKGGRYTEGSVLIRRDAILEKLMIDLAEKNPEWIIGWSDGLPEFDLNQTVFIGDKRKILGLHIAGVVADKWMFASRDCETKAGRRAQIKILGADWREDDEVESEVEEMNTVGKKR